MIRVRPVAYTHISLGLCSAAAFLLGIGAILGINFARDLRHDRSFSEAPQVLATIQGSGDHCWRTKSGTTCRKVPLVSYDRLSEHGGRRFTFAAQHYPGTTNSRTDLSALLGNTVTVRYLVDTPDDGMPSAVVVEWPAAHPKRAVLGLLAIVLAVLAFVGAIAFSPIATWVPMLRHTGFNYWKRVERP